MALPDTLSNIMHDPLRNLMYLDVSFNHLTTVETSLLEFTSLKVLYMHGNQITSLQNVSLLRKLSKLLSLTLNGNPIERSPFYRAFVVGTLQRLKSLDHTTITEEELSTSTVWCKAHLARAKQRRDEKLDASLCDG
eukprot:CAMPEP_0194531656 /NCGR_PEP_ID=MMETSP0253-20130528/69012_1 /TAXON_ID=2966 /ORGANISM="Noctiluca scintillans" /LENGTH=135 /DNA_ID=CAMNT_0039377025 /DNA_START=302 /DNA_END=709 /DNA_ORIENTATION=-